MLIVSRYFLICGNMTDFVVTEKKLPARNLVRVHFVSTKPMNDRAFYNESRSWSAFMNITKPKRRTSENAVYYVKWKYEFDLDLKIHRKNPVLADHFDKAEWVYHKSVDDFYKYIGYNKKTKKYD